jgi:hypothetical protein
MLSACFMCRTYGAWISFSRLPALFWAAAAVPALAHVYIWCSIRHTPWLFSRTRAAGVRAYRRASQGAGGGEGEAGASS